MDRDLLVIGGGINGAGTAADAAGRGLSVVLCEMGDLASGTSSTSSNLIHGGLRYLEQGDIGLVRESLRERKILHKLAAHLVRPQAFVMPYCPWLRPFWSLRVGLYIYDHLIFNTNMPHSRKIRTAELAQLELKNDFHKALEYYDCTTDDSRLVLHVALLARQHGAEIWPHTKLVKAVRKNNSWTVTLLHGNDLKVINVKVIINAAGPWVAQVANDILQIPPKFNLRLVKGSHIIIKRMFKHKQSLILQNKDQRVIFVMPYQDQYTLIGTTDVLLEKLEIPPQISAAEINYLCDIVNEFCQTQIGEKDIVHTYAGIRALYANIDDKIASKMSRDYALDINTDDNLAPVISIYGGKITTYRHLAEKVVNSLQPYFSNLGKPWTTRAYLPGGYFPNDSLSEFTAHILKTYAPIPKTLLLHLIENYGTRTVEILLNCHRLADLGKHFGGNLYQREVDYLLVHEWATTAEDILWRRGKEGLHLTAEGVTNLTKYINVSLKK